MPVFPIFSQPRLLATPKSTRITCSRICMHAAVSSLMIAVIAIQTVFGCCWHHAHLHIQCAQASLLATLATERVTCCKHHHHQDDSKPARPCEDRTACQGTAGYVLPQKVRLDHSHGIALFHFA